MSNKPAIEGGKPIREKMLIFGKPLVEQEEIDAVVSTMESGWLSTGPRCDKFEKEFAEYTDAKYAFAVNSCTSALHLSLVAADIKKDDEVITTPMTFAATPEVILYQGAKPVFVDIEPDTMNINPLLIEKNITDKTKAIMPVHFAGQSCRMDTILDIAKKHNLYVIEDAAHAAESTFGKQKIGGIGDATSFSFYATKNITTGEGGMLTTNRDDWAERIEHIRVHGMSRNAWKRYSKDGFTHYSIVEMGYKYNMMDMQAAMGLCQLSKIERLRKRRLEIVSLYNEAFADNDIFELPVDLNQGVHAWHLYIIRLNLDRLTISRDKFMSALQAENIGVGVHFISLHLHPLYQNLLGCQRDDFPVSAGLSDRIISLPLTPGMAKEDASDVINAVNKLCIAYRK